MKYFEDIAFCASFFFLYLQIECVLRIPYGWNSKRDLLCFIHYNEKKNCAKCYSCNAHVIHVLNFTECPYGSFGINCKQSCPPGYYGRLCRSSCECDVSECHNVTGCITINGTFSILFIVSLSLLYASFCNVM